MVAMRGALASLALAGLGAVGEAFAPGVWVDGHLHTVAAVQSGSAHLPTGGYVVGVRPGTKQALLEELQTSAAWAPNLPMSAQLPLFAGVLKEAELLWLLKQNAVTFIESDDKVATYKAHDSGRRGVTIDGTWYTAAQIEDGQVKLPTCSYFVEVMEWSKKALLSQLWKEWRWQPTDAFSDQSPVFEGLLNQSHIAWLLRFDEVRFIKDECAASATGGRTLSERPVGVSIGGQFYTLGAIQSAKVQVPTGSYIVGVKPNTKQTLLEEMQQRRTSWAPAVVMSQAMPMFIGELDQAQVVWLLQQEAVRFIAESDTAVTIHEGPPPSPLPSGHQAFLAGSP